MSLQARPHLSPEEFLEAEREAVEKSEYRDGEVLAMAVASYVHNLIVANVVAELRQQLKGKDCAVLPSDLRVWIEATRQHVYPDVTVVCGEPVFVDGEQDTLVNPTLLVEVLSKGTRNYDRGDKFEGYRTIETFSEYLLLSQDRPHCEHYLRQEDGSWVLNEVRRLDATVALQSIGCELDLQEVYDKVELIGPRPV